MPGEALWSMAGRQGGRDDGRGTPRLLADQGLALRGQARHQLLIPPLSHEMLLILSVLMRRKIPAIKNLLLQKLPVV